MAEWINLHPWKAYAVLMIGIVVVGFLYAQWDSRNDNHPS